MTDIIALVLAQIDKAELDKCVIHLRRLDSEMDEKMDEIRAVQGSISTFDRINIFTDTDDELRLKEENKRLQLIRIERDRAIAAIKDLIHDALYRDFAVAMKIHAGDLRRVSLGLKVEHKWGVNTANHHYQVRGLDVMRREISTLAEMIDAKFGFPPAPLSAGELLDLVYDEILRREGFISDDHV